MATTMTVQQLSHLQRVRLLYKTILRLHRGLPENLQVNNVCKVVGRKILLRGLYLNQIYFRFLEMHMLKKSFVGINLLVQSKL